MSDNPATDLVVVRNGSLVDPVTHRFVKGPTSLDQKKVLAEKKLKLQLMAEQSARKGFLAAWQTATRDEPGRFPKEIKDLPGAIEAKTEMITTEIMCDPDTKGRDRIAAAEYIDKSMGLAKDKFQAQENSGQTGSYLHLGEEATGKMLDLMRAYLERKSGRE
jgi:hypothetical protein